MNQPPMGEKVVPQPKKTRNKISLLTFLCQEENSHHILCSFFSLLLRYFHFSWNSYSFIVYFTTCSYGCSILNPSMVKHGTECPPRALIIAPPFLIEWLLAQGLISSFKSLTGPLVIYFCRRLPSAQWRADSAGGLKRVESPPFTPLLMCECLLHRS